jgi:hypothetical protein
MTTDDALHRLCFMCQRIKFVLHEPSQCFLLNCQYAAYCQSEPHEVWPHSDAYQHYATISLLEESAGNGCHLCTLLYMPIKYSKQTRCSRSIPKTTGANIFVSRHELQVAYEGQAELVTFGLEDSPGSQCTRPESGRPTPQYHNIATEALFVAKSHFYLARCIPSKFGPGKQLNGMQMIKTIDLTSLEFQGYRGLKYTKFDVRIPTLAEWLMNSSSS